ncbi:hypothetical protein SNR37_003034 [Agarivorans aestuarii]|uniref:Early transcribed membrane protein n=1 Tax=Agarivorans aestuarii TaxID=1563703 RepID=A0ABU7G2G7_9ALTE|nr:hypothetical protein [Agarivorans aestuarii]MEE1673608.1 hypothetical protein [Agarivorans aestuarii]
MKVVISTFTLTLATLVIILKLSFSSLLSFVGYAAIPINELHKLTASNIAIEKLKNNHVNKKTRVTKRFAKRTAKKVGATAVSAATIGTVAVIGTMTYIEINEFCEDQRQLSEEENILFNKNLTFDFSACVKSAKEDSTEIAQEAWTMVKQSGKSAVESVDEALDPSRRELTKAFEAIDQFFN